MEPVSPSTTMTARRECLHPNLGNKCLPNVDLTKEDGAVQMLEVVEEVKDILIGVLKPGNFWKTGAWVSHS